MHWVQVPRSGVWRKPKVCGEMDAVSYGRRGQGTEEACSLHGVRALEYEQGLWAIAAWPVLQNNIWCGIQISQAEEVWGRDIGVAVFDTRHGRVQRWVWDSALGERFDTETNDGAVLQIGSGDRTPSSGQEGDRDMFQQTMIMIMIMREVHLTIQK